MTVWREFFHLCAEEKQGTAVAGEAPDLQPGRNGPSCLLKGPEEQGKDLFFFKSFRGQMGSGQLLPGEEEGGSLAEYVHGILQSWFGALIIPENGGAGQMQ